MVMAPRKELAAETFGGAKTFWRTGERSLPLLYMQLRRQTGVCQDASTSATDGRKASGM